MKVLRDKKEFLIMAIGNLRDEINDWQLQKNAIQALIDEAKSAGVGE